MAIVKNSEKRCYNMTEAVNKKLGEIRNATEQAAITRTAPAVSTPNSAASCVSSPPINNDEFDDDIMDWEIPTPPIRKPRRTTPQETE